MKKEIDYTKRFNLFSEQVLYQSLDDESKMFIRKTGFKYRLSFQELRQITEIAVDLRMWSEPSLATQWNELELLTTLEGRARKKRLLQKLTDRWLLLKNQETVYKSHAAPPSSPFDPKKLTIQESNNEVFGMCPVASEKTVCCNLKTIDVIQGCVLGCSYCSIQTFYDPDNIAIVEDLSEKLDNIVLNPNKRYHIGSGQSSDSLALGNRNGILDAQMEFAMKNPNVILEFKTKSKNVKYFLETDIPKNVFVSWSLNPQVIIDQEEHRTATLTQRLRAAQKVADKGIRVGFHFHPMVHYQGWKNDYRELIETLLDMFSAEEVALVSFGTLTFIKPAIKSLRLKGIKSKVLQIPLEEAAGKFSYPMRIKEELFRTAWDAFQPWRDRVFFYLCMEGRELWETVFGFCYGNNEEFEEALFDHVNNKLGVFSNSTVI
ncbi:MAG: hypothetical protein IID16_05170 [Candidatus Marinimicrobia bacterium]|nr:hypothetical protein [Candidatus Neomarinimicrobiota bacterium]